MDAEERLSLEEVREPTLMSAHHLHRYHLAGELCSGLRVLDLACGVGYGAQLMSAAGAASVRGVDLDAEAVDRAREAFADERTSFEAADAIEFLRRLTAADFDAIVVFEALEHVEAVEEALDLLAELGRKGVRLLLSVPNSLMFKERNPFHLTDFGFESAQRAFARFPGAQLLYQHIAEGSVICGTGHEFRGVVEGLDRGEPEYANTFIAAIGFPAGQVTAATAHLNVVATPNHNRFMLELERANVELRRTNLRLAREWMGRSDAGGASVLSRHEREREALTEQVSWLEAELVRSEKGRKVAEEAARVNNENYVRELSWRDAPRYHAVDRLRDGVARVPLLSPLLRATLRVFARRR